MLFFFSLQKEGEKRVAFCDSTASFPWRDREKEKGCVQNVTHWIHSFDYNSRPALYLMVKSIKCPLYHIFQDTILEPIQYIHGKMCKLYFLAE